LALGRRHAITDEDERGLLDRHAIDGPQRDRGHVLLLHECTTFAVQLDTHRGVERHLRSHQRHDLGVFAVRAGGLEPERLELGDEVLDRLRLTGSPRCAALEFVGSERARDVRKTLRADGRAVRLDGVSDQRRHHGAGQHETHRPVSVESHHVS
jgi:hypothetical protein